MAELLDHRRPASGAGAAETPGVRLHSLFQPGALCAGGLGPDLHDHGVLAQYYAGFLPLTIKDAPFGFPPMRYYQLWHERAGRSQEVRWLRDLVAQAINKLLAERSASDSSRP